ncbi:MAG: hypothetical protein P4K83_00200 [Terracidiphilus sp.]|nr:hypothetical protein [Terracidiphilus sp.]
MRVSGRVTCAMAVLVCASLVAQQGGGAREKRFRFEQYPTKTYQGLLATPGWLHRESDGEWTDEAGKPAFPPEVTFAGEYLLDARSCGTECRYYKLTNLRTGKDVKQISRFDAGEDLPVTDDGHPYMTILYYKPGSRMLIAQYLLDFRDHHKQQGCRQQYFVLENAQIKPISKAQQFCTREGQERQ